MVSLFCYFFRFCAEFDGAKPCNFLPNQRLKPKIDSDLLETMEKASS